MPYFKHIEPTDIPDTHPVGRFYSYWQGLDKQEGLASWPDVKASQVAAIMPWMMLLEKTEAQYLYRVCGSQCERIFGMTYQGKVFGEGLSAEAVEIRQKEFIRVEESGFPLFSANTLPIPDKEYREVYRGVFGFANKADQCNWLAVVIAPQEEI